MARSGTDVVSWMLRTVAAAGLAVGAYVHWDLAPTYDGVRAAGAPHFSQGQLFRLQAIAAVVVALLVLLMRNRWTALLAVAVALGSVGAVVLYRYVDVGAVGLPVAPRSAYRSRRRWI